MSDRDESMRRWLSINKPTMSAIIHDAYEAYCGGSVTLKESFMIRLCVKNGNADNWKPFSLYDMVIQVCPTLTNTTLVAEYKQRVCLTGSIYCPLLIMEVIMEIWNKLVNEDERPGRNVQIPDTSANTLNERRTMIFGELYELAHEQARLATRRSYLENELSLVTEGILKMIQDGKEPPAI